MSCRTEAEELLGYYTIGHFALGCCYTSVGVTGGPVNEFKTMLKNLHAAGIEVILDVVYNHIAEGNQLGPTLSFRGIYPQAYLREVLTRLLTMTNRQIKDVTPEACAKAQPASAHREAA